MPSAKGKPTNSKLREKVTEEVKQQPNKDGSGKGQMAAWKATKIGKEYEARGGDYENEPGSKDRPQKGPPQKKSVSEKEAENSKPVKTGREKDDENEENIDLDKAEQVNKEEDVGGGDRASGEEEKPKANEGKQARGRPAKKDGEKKGKKEKKEPAKGGRTSARNAGKIVDYKETDEPKRRRNNEDEEVERPAAKKGKVKK
ncbi:hypothetical protein BGZ60DRAFT_401442 [Tricladium varicosporioides]|nr:hypothetical protein BGZ60DRAFT_401442 [Hymenoscyphus varicosporioides]